MNDRNIESIAEACIGNASVTCGKETGLDVAHPNTY